MTGLRDLSKKQRSIAKSNGIKDKTLSNRLHSGWEVERAITQAPLVYTGGMNYKGNHITKTQREQANAIGISDGLIQWRLEIGWTVEQAVSTPVRKYKKKMNSKNISNQEVFEVIGRIKYYNSINAQTPMVYPKKMVQQLNEMGYQVEDVKALAF